MHIFQNKLYVEQKDFIIIKTNETHQLEFVEPSSEVEPNVYPRS